MHIRKFLKFLSSLFFMQDLADLSFVFFSSWAAPLNDYKSEKQIAPAGLFSETANKHHDPRVNMGDLTSFPCITPGKAAGMRARGDRGLDGLQTAPHARGNVKVYNVWFTLVDHQDGEH